MDSSALISDALREIRETWQVQDEAVKETEDGFNWTPGSHLIQVVAYEDTQQNQSQIRISVTTNLLRDVLVTNSTFINLLDAMSRFITSTYCLTYPPAEFLEGYEIKETSYLSMFSSIYLTKSTAGWLPKFFAQLAIMQPVDAEFRSNVLSDILQSGVHDFARSQKVEDCNGILKFADHLFVSAGAETGKWLGSPEFVDFAEKYGRSDQCYANGDHTGLTAEVPFGSDSALIKIIGDQRHPQLGNGLLVTLQLPFCFERTEIVRLASSLNFYETKFWTGFPQLGCWHSNESRGSSVLAHSSFIPNALFSQGLVVNVTAWAAARANWAKGKLWPDLDDLPMSKIIQSRYENFAENSESD